MLSNDYKNAPLLDKKAQAREVLARTGQIYKVDGGGQGTGS